ncbi:hypothetical protein OKW21_001565 [Catalinimonas alkaloidigena]|uniref:hypothetical protein n=1 Tax=Catalinimonas alkaloidigena TaxID=1075417 RepID=UPI00240716A2|nr:hypothetical protein [Catalinimonas alkaloidigena]MDF9796302.1 hypothetical protein [Catalinimonas alkaloidigena]
MKKVSTQQRLMAEILTITAKIQKEFPEHYEQLSETPLFLRDQRKGIHAGGFEEYLESLRSQFKTFNRFKVNAS